MESRMLLLYIVVGCISFYPIYCGTPKCRTPKEGSTTCVQSSDCPFGYACTNKKCCLTTICHAGRPLKRKGNVFNCEEEKCKKKFTCVRDDDISASVCCKASKNKMAHTRRIVNTIDAPEVVGPYSQAVMIGQTLYMAGQIGIEPSSGAMVEGGVEPEAHQVFKNMLAVLASAGGAFTNVVKSTVLLADIKDYATVNTIYAQYFKEPYPARAAFEVAALPAGAMIEVEAIAVLGEIVDE